MADPLSDLHNSLQDALDELASPRSSSDTKTRALETLERHLAVACVPKDSTENLEIFLALQYTFECNVPSRILPWIGTSTSKLEILTNRGVMDQEREAEAFTLSSQLSLALSLIQGVALNHPSSKKYLGRKYALEVLLDLLLASRHLPATPSASPNSGVNTPSPPPPPPLSSVVLDTLLCILVDASAAIRAFEGTSGVQVVVKILKRAGTPREVRMKCLEFLYFYLLDETPTSSSTLLPSPRITSQTATPTPTAPTTPLRRAKPYISATPLHPSSRQNSSNFTFSSTLSGSTPHPSSSRSTSGSSSNSFSSTSSNASSSATSASLSSSPEKLSSVSKSTPKTPPSSPPVAQRPAHLQPRSLLMLRKDVDYVPQSPKKLPPSRSSVSGSRHVRGKSLSSSRSRLGSYTETDDGNQQQQRVPSSPGASTKEGTGEQQFRQMLEKGEKTRTTEEKKELLGTMLGNVDALVEGVRKAGIWGLG